MALSIGCQGRNERTFPPSGRPDYINVGALGTGVRGRLLASAVALIVYVHLENPADTTSFSS